MNKLVLEIIKKYTESKLKQRVRKTLAEKIPSDESTEKDDAGYTTEEILDAVSAENEENSYPCVYGAHIKCTSALESEEFVHMDGEGSPVEFAGLQELTAKDTKLYEFFSGCQNSKNGLCEPVIEPEQWREPDCSDNTVMGKPTLDYLNSYMICTKGRGMLYFEEHGQKIETAIEEWEVSDYTNDIIEFIKQKEGFKAYPYNEGRTVGYGFDMYKYLDVKINWNEDGSISEKEGERLLIYVLNRGKDDVNRYLESEGKKLDQNAYDATMDLVYNRNVNPLTKEIISAMADRDDEKVWKLFEDFDYRYAEEYLKKEVKNPQEYVDRNPGLKVRREEEYSIYQNGFLEIGENE